LKNITISLSKDEKPVKMIQPTTVKNIITPKQNLMNMKTKREKSIDKTEVRVIDLNLAQIESEAKEKKSEIKRSLIAEKLNGLKERIKNLLGGGSNVLTIVRQKPNK